MRSRYSSMAVIFRRGPRSAPRRGSVRATVLQAAMPSPDCEDTRRESGFGITFSTERVHDAMEADVRQVRQEIDLREQHEIGLAEHHRVLERLVLALGHREHHDVGGLAEVVDGGADQVADVLDEEVVELAPRQVVQRVVHHLRVEMARRAGRDRRGGDAGRRAGARRRCRWRDRRRARRSAGCRRARARWPRARRSCRRRASPSG